MHPAIASAINSANFDQARLADVAEALVVRNRCEGRCRVLFTPTLEGDPTCLIRKVAPPTCLIRQLPYTAGASVHVGADRFDAAITEEISDDLPGGDCISTARFCRAGLLRPSGTFYPRRAAMCAHLPYMATTCLMWQPQQQVGAAGGRARVPRGGIRRARL